jgi:4-hydroxy-3-polyprenylbenzoate decarboxylase
MSYKNLHECLIDLERHSHLVRVTEEVDPYLEMAEIQRRVYAAKGPAVLYTNVKGTKFPCVSNIFGTMERTRFIFRHTLDDVRKLIDLKTDLSNLIKKPWRYAGVPLTALTMIPKRKFSGPVMARQCRVDELPQIQSWPKDGGAFITLPQVYTEHPDFPGWRMSNLGMYRIQLSGGNYVRNQQIGLHYQIHRSIGVHHHAAIRRGEKLKVSIFVGGAPAMAVAAVMPLPEGLTELAFAGALGGRRIRYVGNSNGYTLACDADFCITGTIDPGVLLPEGPFGDHLGYYSVMHDFPVLNVEKIFHRRDAVWPFTVVGRPPQEDTTFGELIHEITGPLIPTVISGLHAVHAVDAAGVHPLLLAIGSERYVPYGERRPQEILTIANAILGQGQLSLAKYLFITAREDDPDLSIYDIESFFMHVLQRINWETDLHFQTQTTMDTLDYTGPGLNEGSKVVLAAAGKIRRALGAALPSELVLPKGFDLPKIAMPGVLVIRARPFKNKIQSYKERSEERRVGKECKA